MRSLLILGGLVILVRRRGRGRRTLAAGDTGRGMAAMATAASRAT